MYIRTESQPAIKRREKKLKSQKDKNDSALRRGNGKTRHDVGLLPVLALIMYCSAPPTTAHLAAPPAGTQAQQKKTAVMMKNVCVHSLRVVERIRKRNPPHFLHTHAKGSAARRARLMATPT